MSHSYKVMVLLTSCGFSGTPCNDDDDESGAPARFQARVGKHFWRKFGTKFF